MTTVSSVSAMPDVQGGHDARQIAISRVGIRGIRIPLSILEASGNAQTTVANAELTVALAHDKKGTHMSRFVQMIQQKQTKSLADFIALHTQMLELLEAEAGTIEFGFPFFMTKLAPVSGVASLLDYDVRVWVDGARNHSEAWVEVTVPVTSLCPCSKEISKYGAHNQRSHVVINALFDSANPFNLEELITIAESGASCPIWSTLKRPDEKYITEKAYENPKFVEDIVRDVATALNANPRVMAYVVSSENFESIHNHSAYAVIEHDKR